VTRPSGVPSGQSQSLAHGCLLPLCCLIGYTICGDQHGAQELKVVVDKQVFCPSIATSRNLIASLTTFTMPHYEDEPKIDTSAATGDWRESLFRDGFVVVKGVLSSGKAQHYRERMFQWLETFPYGFKTDDAGTWGKDHLPEHMK
jgi:hypothetical protein